MRLSELGYCVPAPQLSMSCKFDQLPTSPPHLFPIQPPRTLRCVTTSRRNQQMFDKFGKSITFLETQYFVFGDETRKLVAMNGR